MVFGVFCDCEEMVVVQEEAGVCGESVDAVCVCVCDIHTEVPARKDERIQVSRGGCVPREMFHVVHTRVSLMWLYQDNFQFFLFV